MNPYKLTVTLRQHTPLLHFQHDQAGATLRASEVKPKLDRFLLKCCAGQIHASWLLNTPEGHSNALNYQLRTMPVKSNCSYESYSGYFGNMAKKGEEKQEKHPVMSTTGLVELQFWFAQEALKTLVAENLNSFFSWHNFGTRQSRGFGCFFPDGALPNLSYSFKLELQDLDKIFESIDWFSRSLRAGLNLKKKRRDKQGREIKDEYGKPILDDDFYFKSLLFKYVTDPKNQWNKSFQWEKKTIKSAFFSGDLESQTKHRTLNGTKIDSFNEALWFSSENKQLFKDLLGLSSVESWQSYKATITKKLDGVSSDDPKYIDRFSSPILFKPIETDDGWVIYFDCKPDTYCFSKYAGNEMNYLGKKFSITSTRPTTSTPILLALPESFNIEHFLDYVFDCQNFNIDAHVEKHFHLHPAFKLLQEIYKQLQNRS